MITGENKKHKWEGIKGLNLQREIMVRSMFKEKDNCLYKFLFYISLVVIAQKNL